MYKLEQKLDEWLVQKAPFQLPQNGKTTLVKAMPWLTLIGGILCALAVLSLYNAAMLTQNISNYGNAVSQAYGYSSTAYNMTMVWFGLAVLALEAVLFFIAFPALKARKKSGWYLLYYVAAANVIYAVIYLIADQNIGSFIFSLISSVIGLYILFQIRGSYTGVKTSKPSDQTSKGTTTTIKQ